MLKKLKRRVCEANASLPRYGLVLFTWGNASEIDDARKHMVIKPSGVRYEELTPELMCVIDMESSLKIEGCLNPSTDAPTHLELYRRFPEIKGIVHTHSAYATAFAQAGLGIPCYGTTHADYFYGEIPCVRALTADEINGDYEINTGRVVADAFESRGAPPSATPGALVNSHGPFAWGGSAAEAAANAAYLEEVARLAYLSLQLSAAYPAGCANCSAPAGMPIGVLKPVSQELADRHYYRKHGAQAYYGQK